MSCCDKISTALHGAAKMIDLLSQPGITPTEHRRRRDVCKFCPSRNGSWCGEMLAATQDTCGCLITLKIMVPSEKCPQGKW